MGELYLEANSRRVRALPAARSRSSIRQQGPANTLPRNYRATQWELSLHVNYSNSHANQPRTIRGPEISRQKRRLGPEGRALYTAEISKCRIVDLTPAQLRQLTGASAGYTAPALTLTAEERASIHVGVSNLSTFHNARRASSPVRIVDGVIKRYGADFVFDRTMASIAAE
jgi:hypothetical protein